MTPDNDDQPEPERPLTISKEEAEVIRSGLIQMKKGLESQLRGVCTIISRLEKMYGLESSK